MKTQEKLRHKYTGCMLGAAIGDAIGKQNEGLKRGEILEKGPATDYGNASPGCPGDKLGPGQYTDDTEQMIVLAQSMIKCKGLDIVDFAQRIAQWGTEALADPVRKSLIGPSSSAAITRLNSGMSWKDSGGDIPSCGSSMRVAPIGLFYKDPDEIESMASLSSIPTHNSGGAIAGAVAVAVGVRCALLDMDCPELIEQVSSRASRHDPELGRKIGLSFREKDAAPDKVFAGLGTSYLVSETVPSAFFCFSRHFDNPENAVIEAVNSGGDTDSIACITGALCGALHGIEAFPPKWLKGLENGNMIKQLAEIIFEISI